MRHALRSAQYDVHAEVPPHDGYKKRCVCIVCCTFSVPDNVEYGCAVCLLGEATFALIEASLKAFFFIERGRQPFGK